MTWVKLDDGFAEHPKIVGLSDGAFRLLVASFCYCGRWGTDGLLPQGALKMKPAHVRELISRGNWHESGHECGTCPAIANGAHYVHEFLVHNPSAEEVEVAQGRRKEKARKAARARWEKPPSNAPSSANGNAPSMPGGMLPDAPVPYPSVDSHPSHSEPRHPQAVDDEELRIEGPPLDPVAVKRRAVLERIVDIRTEGIAPKTPGPYRVKVLAQKIEEHGAELDRLLELYPDAPVESFAGQLLGEPNSLHLFRRLA